jgi:hypothetical protein
VLGGRLCRVVCCRVTGDGKEKPEGMRRGKMIWIRHTEGGLCTTKERDSDNSEWTDPVTVSRDLGFVNSRGIGYTPQEMRYG